MKISKIEILTLISTIIGIVVKWLSDKDDKKK